MPKIREKKQKKNTEDFFDPSWIRREEDIRSFYNYRSEL
jgi:hypothetical protein